MKLNLAAYVTAASSVSADGGVFLGLLLSSCLVLKRSGLNSRDVEM